MCRVKVTRETVLILSVVLNITEPCVCLAAARLIFELRRFDVRPMLLSRLLTLLRPAKEEEQHKFHNLEGDIITICFYILAVKTVIPEDATNEHRWG